MIEFLLVLANSLIFLTALVFAWESTKMVEEKKQRQREKKNKQFYETYYYNTWVGFFHGRGRR